MVEFHQFKIATWISSLVETASSLFDIVTKCIAVLAREMLLRST